MKPLAIDLYAGLGGWSDGLLAEGYNVVGFDIERHQYGTHRYPAQLVVQDVLTLHGAQFRNAALIVASPPCQEYSYMAMPWKLGKAKAAAIRADITGQMLADLNRLFDACFRIQAQASIAAGRHIPMVVENVRGAQRWVGQARWSFGSYFLWGDIPALMPAGKPIKVRGQDWSRYAKTAEVSPHWRMQKSLPAGVRPTSLAWGNESRWFNDGPRSPNSISSSSSSSPRRKAASAMIAKIPFALSRHIAAVYYPRG